MHLLQHGRSSRGLQVSFCLPASGDGPHSCHDGTRPTAASPIAIATACVVLLLLAVGVGVAATTAGFPALASAGSASSSSSPIILNGFSCLCCLLRLHGNIHKAQGLPLEKAESAGCMAAHAKRKGACCAR
eukprot:1161691-Pelagomonas_calceolata.AAC.10